MFCQERRADKEGIRDDGRLVIVPARCGMQKRQGPGPQWNFSVCAGQGRGHPHGDRGGGVSSD